MTDEERQKLCTILRSMYADRWCDCDNEPCDAAADEIEQLAARVNALEHIINLDMYEVTKTALVQAQDEIERLQRELRSTLGLLYQESERRVEAADEIERLIAENKRLKEDAESWRRQND